VSAYPNQAFAGKKKHADRGAFMPWRATRATRWKTKGATLI